ncbi:MAG: molybdopterin-dependent oxidoreductase [Bacillota bacterium]|nr:molybdopterin-dependent oxidoreductase [Bacillota bacterium]
MKELVAFFTSFEAYLPFRKEITEQEYQDILYGTNANIYVPLWASCKNGQDILNNEITLEVIQFYKKYGYAARNMDGNPLDYIGNQLLFLQYLANAKAKEAMDTFIHLYFIDTISLFMQALPYTNLDLEDIKRKLKDIVLQGVPLEKYHPLLPSLPLEEYHVVCSAGINNCGGKCRIDIGVQEGCILNVDTDRNNPIPLRSCVRGRGYKYTFMNSRRLRYPMKRIGKRGEGKFKRITYEEAAKKIAQKMEETIQIAPESRYVIYSTGISAYMRPDDMIKRLLNIQGGYLEAYNSYSSACASYTTPYVYGDACSGNSEEDILNTNYLILWGHNPSESIFGSHRNYYLSKLKQKGVKIVVIDPRESDSAIAYADQWIGIKPSSDAALADAMAYVIYENNLQDQHFIDTYCLGFDKNHMPKGYESYENVHDYLYGLVDGIVKTPEWASKLTGIPAKTIETLAVEYASAKPACILPGLGFQRTLTGEQSERGLMMLACLTGNVGIAGGGAAGAGWTNEHFLPEFPIGKRKFEGIIPTFLWSKAIEKGTTFDFKNEGLKGVDRLRSNIKLIFNLAGNTLVNQHSNINETIKILEDESKAELIVGSDLFWTASTKYVDLLLPGTSVFEGNNIALPWTYGHYLLHNTQAIQPLFGCRFEYEWISLVAKELGLEEAFNEGRNFEEWLRYGYEQTRKHEPDLPDYAQFKKEGGYFYTNAKPFIAYQRQIENGLPFSTPSGKIEIFSPSLVALENPNEIPAIPKYVASLEGVEDPLKERYPLQLIGYHTKRRCHSIHDQNEFLEKVDPPALWVHPEDAAKRGIEQGDTILVYNDRGQVRIPAKVTKRIVPGVVAMSQGGWYTPDKNGVDIRGSINVLTMTHKTSPLAKGNPQHTNLVEVKKVEE